MADKEREKKNTSKRQWQNMKRKKETYEESSSEI